jgi:ribonuclease HI
MKIKMMMRSNNLSVDFILNEILKRKQYLSILKEVLPQKISDKNIKDLFQEIINIGEEIKREVEYDIYFDGASSGNPGPSSVGVVIKYKENIIESFSKYIGFATNNQAEYIACIEALQFAKKCGYKRINIYSDSELLIKQLQGEYKIKNQTLYGYYREIMEIKEGFTRMNLQYIPREQNKDADKLAKSAIELYYKDERKDR